jgi:hypothetical protein
MSQKRPVGRPKGSVSRLDAYAREKAIADGLTPLEYLLSILRDTEQPQETRIDAAKAAAPYVHARLQTVDMKAETTVHHVALPTLPTADEWEQRHATGH